MAPTSLPQLVSPAAIKSIASSGITHVALLSALAGWSISAALQLPSFPGQPVATQIELILLELEQLPTAVEFSAPEPQVLIMPHRAELAGQVFVDTLDWHAELDVELDADLLRRVVAAENAAAATPAAPIPTEATPLAKSQSQPPATPSPRRAEAPQPEDPSAAGAGQRVAPDLAGNRPPRYPDIARQRGWQGTVILQLTISIDGTVISVAVARSSGHPILDAEAVNAVRQWRGTPATLDGQPVGSIELLPIRFRLP